MLRDSIIINNFNWNPVVLKKKLLKPLKINILLVQLVQKWYLHGPRPEQKTIFLAEITKPDHKLSKTFYFIKYHMFWLSYECFSILCDAFLVKSVISSHPNGFLYLLRTLEKLQYTSYTNFTFEKININFLENLAF